MWRPLRLVRADCVRGPVAGHGELRSALSTPSRCPKRHAHTHAGLSSSPKVSFSAPSNPLPSGEHCPTDREERPITSEEARSNRRSGVGEVRGNARVTGGPQDSRFSRAGIAKRERPVQAVACSSPLIKPQWVIYRADAELGLTTRRYQVDTIRDVAMTLRLTEDEQVALRERADAEGISMQEAARRAVRDYVVQGQHRDRVSLAARRVLAAHADALRRLCE